MLLLILLLNAKEIKAQQDPMFTHYMFNTLAINPGYAGSREALTITGLHRTQWAGFTGAPTTQTVIAHTPFLRHNIGLGLSFLNDKVGPVNMTSIYIDFSYTIKVTQKSKLAFGLKGGSNFMKNDLNALALHDPTDISFNGNIEKEFLPNFGAGLYYYTDKWYIGVSVPKILENSFETGITNKAGEAKHYFLIAGTYFNLNESFKFKPTGFLKITEAAPIELDVTATIVYKDKIWGGLMYRTDDALGAMLGMYIKPELAIGYSFDWSFNNPTMKHNMGSHEILIQYDLFFTEKKKIRSPRYF